MERYLLDTSAILHILRGTKTGSDIVRFVKDADLTTSVICYCETLNNSNLDKQAEAEEFLSCLAILPVTLSDGEAAKKIQYACRKDGKHVPTTDCIIAGTARNNDLEMVTADSDFARIEGIKKRVF